MIDAFSRCPLNLYLVYNTLNIKYFQYALKLKKKGSFTVTILGVE
jgi:hypothetical protein